MREDDVVGAKNLITYFLEQLVTGLVDVQKDRQFARNERSYRYNTVWVAGLQCAAKFKCCASRVINKRGSTSSRGERARRIQNYAKWRESLSSSPVAQPQTMGGSGVVQK
jgi:hypothetical protein